jgi:hypothetical protein
MSALELVSTVLVVGVVLGVFVVLPVVALWRSRQQAPAGRDPAFLQHSEHPMPDKSYHGQNSAGGM